MLVELRDSLEFLYADSTVGKRPCRSMNLDIARGGTVSVHVLLNDLVEGKTVRAVLRSKGRIVRDVKWFRLIDVPVEVNTGPVGFVEKEGEHNQFVARRAPFHVYDAMEPVESAIRVSSPTMALRLHILVSENARIGKRDYTLEIRSGRDLQKLSLTVSIYKPIITPVGERQSTRLILPRTGSQMSPSASITLMASSTASL